MPDWTQEIRRRLAPARLAAADEADVIEELAQHLDERYRDLIARGASEADARRGALEELEDGGALGERLRGVSGARRSEPVALGAREGQGMMAGLWNDLRFGARLLRRAPGFTAVVALTFALGVAANTTIFSIVNALLLRPMPGVAQPDELVLLGRTQGGEGFDTFAYPDYLDYRDGAPAMADVAAYYAAAGHLSTGGASERIRLRFVSDNYFRTLGTRAAHGRLLLPGADDLPDAAPVIVLGHGLWQRRFGSDPGIVGRVVGVNGQPFTVVGVAPSGFDGVEVGSAPDAFVPLGAAARVLPDGASLFPERGAVWLTLFGRLAPGATPARAQAELGTIAARLRQQYPETNEERGIVVAPGIGFSPDTRREVRTYTGVLLGVVGLVLLIACANVANLLLARGSVRVREMALRASLGASRTRLVRQLLAEGILLALLGGVVGLLLAVVSLPVVLRLPVFADSGLLTGVSFDARVLAFTAAVALVSGIVFTLPPALRASRARLVESLKAGAPGAGDGSSRLRNGLVVGQLALSLVLLAGAGLFVRTLRALYAVEPGFETRQVLVASVDLGLQGYDEPRGRRFFEQLERRAAALPGVRSAALGYMLPLGGGGWDMRVLPGDATPAPDDPGVKTDVNAVSPGYFATVDIPLLRGRGFATTDDAGAPAVVVVNQALADRLWPGRDPVGQSIRRVYDGALLEVVGVVPTAKYRSLLESPRPFVYLPVAQSYQSAMTLHVRSDGDPHALVPAVERLVAELDPNLPVYRVGTLAERLDDSLGAQRSAAALVGGYGVLALLLAAVGLYGSVGYAVARRTREIGIRMAMGASRRTVMGQVMGEALRIALLGAVIGLVAAIPATRLIRSQLFGVGSDDPLTFGVVAALLTAVAIVAAVLPARRATRVDPMVALRAE